ncbi:Permease of the major facilitator superfamily [Pseudomonas chlororaphis subsp. aurantiaca]|uniref:hypothetical protein n=1 Tax=Pseudomonas chlororaphis TaxID=587753 RepID=UPI000BE2A390|nr:hypothetical protein [Pseudomonas chlororaphis]AZD35945.1 Permease of the major facilitator superfamily [Pseudomonas chlororaphis subsp. aurantiaca]AZD42282.1 Permease of the major facilitator superfamily [Pseudomonas chlororaphis subsp. aurantiaca]
MELRNIVICAACFILVSAGLVYGLKLLRKRNYLLGLEWLVVAFSATNALLYFSLGSETAYLFSYFCDAFSRGVGIPVITIIGFMAVTHDYKPSVFKDVMLFAGGMLVTLALVLSAHALGGFLAYFYVVMWTVFSLYLVYLVLRLLSAGEHILALGLFLGMLAAQTIACIYDFYKIPGDETNVLLNFYVLALLSWACLLVLMYYAYSALERTKESMPLLQPR